jgi:hypothetical protein
MTACETWAGKRVSAKARETARTFWDFVNTAGGVPSFIEVLCLSHLDPAKLRLHMERSCLSNCAKLGRGFVILSSFYVFTLTSYC